MRLRNIPGADEAILNSEYCIKEPESKKGNWQSVFSSTQPLHIEIGMGKGRFLMDMASLHPEIILPKPIKRLPSLTRLNIVT